MNMLPFISISPDLHSLDSALVAINKATRTNNSFAIRIILLILLLRHYKFLFRLLV